MTEVIIGPNPCPSCGGDYGQHRPHCARTNQPDTQSPPVDDALEKCPKCRGDGFTKDHAMVFDCSVCDGTGTVSRSATVDDALDREAEVVERKCRHEGAHSLNHVAWSEAADVISALRAALKAKDQDAREPVAPKG